MVVDEEAANDKAGYAERVGKFVSENFQLRQCKRYVRVELSESIAATSLLKANDCVCGRARELHWKVLAEQIENRSNTNRWLLEEDTTLCPCDCFGQLLFVPGDGVDPASIFPGASAHFVRLPGHSDSDRPHFMDEVYKLLKSKQLWGLPTPQLIIDVIGVADPLPHIEQEVLDRFNDGLISAVKTANAWIVTGGINTGVMGLVGDAVTKWRMTHKEHITCIGIAGWGVVEHRDRLEIDAALLSKSYKNSKFISKHGRNLQSWRSVVYPVDKLENCENGLALNAGHNCFLLIDNGLEKRFGEEEAFRSEFVQYLAGNTLRGTAGMVAKTPIVLLVVGGGFNTLTAVETATANSTKLHQRTSLDLTNANRPRPVVLLSGFGGAADLLAFAYMISSPITNRDHHFFKGSRYARYVEESDIPPDFDDRIKRHPAFEEVLENATTRLVRLDQEAIIVKKIRNCLEDRSLITVVNLFEDHGERVLLDHAIVNAIFKTDYGSPAATFELAQMWNRADVARRLLSRHEPEIRSHVDMTATMTKALLNGQTDFVKLLVDFKLNDLRSYITLSQLRTLYSELFIQRRGKPGKSTCVWLFRSLLMNKTGSHTLAAFSDSPKMLEKIGDILSDILGCYLDNVFTEEKWYLTAEDEEEDAEEDKNPDKPRLVMSKEIRPYATSLRDLFLLLLLILRNDLALYIWKIAHDHLGTALMASVFLKALSKEANQLDMTDLESAYLEQSKEWRQRAIFMLSSCYDKEPQRCSLLLTRRLITWQNLTLLDMAFYGSKKQFMAQPAVQTTLSKIWLGRMATFTPSSLIYLTMFPPLMPFLIFRIRFEESVSDFAIEPSASCCHCCQSQQRNKRSRIGDVNINGETTDGGGHSHHHDGNRLPKPNADSHDVTFKKASLLHGGEEGHISVFRAVYLVISSPTAKYVTHSFVLVVFLLVFSYFVLEGTHSANIGGVEITIWVCCFIYLLDLIRDGFGKESLSIEERLEDFFTNPWVIFELVGISLVIVAVVLRYQHEADTTDFVYAHTSYATACVIFWLKSLRIFFVTEGFGPVVFTMFKMIQDLVFFVLIYIILLLSFSMPIYALMNPHARVGDSKNFASLFLNITYDRMWNIFVMGLDRARAEIEGSCSSDDKTTQPVALVQAKHHRLQQFSMNNSSSSTKSPSDFVGQIFNNLNDANSSSSIVDGSTMDAFIYESSNYNTYSGGFDSCTSRNVVGIIMYIIYLLLTNIVLLNMLIAMFAHTVDKTRQTATLLWRFDMYRFLCENYNRPVLPGPLMIFELTYRFCRQIYRKCCGGNVPQNTDLGQYFPSLNDYEYRKMEMYERSAIDACLAASASEETAAKAQELILGKVHKVEEKLNAALEALAELTNVQPQINNANRTAPTTARF